MAPGCKTLAVLILFFGAAAPCPASSLTEVWRSPLGTIRSTSLNTSDGSLWAATGSGVTHLAADGTILTTTEGFWSPWCVSVNPTDGSCWVADSGACQVVKLAPDGRVLLRVDGFDHPLSVSANPRDGSCWVADTSNGFVVHLDSAGREVFRQGDFHGWTHYVAVCPSDGSCWVASVDLVHFSADGVEICRWSGFARIAETVGLSPDPKDGSCWVVRYDVWGTVYHLSATGAVLWQSDEGRYNKVGVNAADGSYWTTGIPLIHWAADGAEISRHDILSGYSIEVDPSDGSIWLPSDSLNPLSSSEWQSGLVHYDEDGREILRVEKPFGSLAGLSVDPVDESLWVTDSGKGEIVHLNGNAEELWRGGGFVHPASVSVNPADGSCWVADREYQLEMPPGSVSHVSGDGTLLWQGSFLDPASISVNRTDGSCWVAERLTGDIVRLGQDGTELWRGGDFTTAEAVAASFTDGSCWAAGIVSDTDHRVVRYAADGSELARVPVYAHALSVDPRDGSCWVASTADVFHLASDGTVLSRTEGFNLASGVWVDPNDGTCWVSDVVTRWRRGTGWLVHLARDGTWLEGTGGFSSALLSGGESSAAIWAADGGNGQLVLLYRWFSDVDRWHWALQAILACYQAGIVAGYDDGLYHPERPVDRAAMAVYIARALTGGEDNVPDGPAMPTFYDVPTDYWAYDHVEYCYGQTIVQGYSATTYAPTVQVTRDQMAVYIARSLATPTGEAGLVDYVPSDPRNFPDVLPTSWAYKHIEYCVETGVVHGYDDGYYRPLVVVTRDQMAVYVARAFDLIPD